MWVSKKAVKEQGEQVAELKSMVNTLTSVITSFPGDKLDNSRKYTTKVEQVQQAKLKYKGCASWGNIVTQRIVNLRVAFSMPNRLFLMPNPAMPDEGDRQGSKEAKEYLKAFMTANGLDGSVPRDLAKEAELQGQVVVRLVWDDAKNMAMLKYYPWDATNYTVTATDEYLISSDLLLEYVDDNGKNVAVKDDEFSFIAFNDELISYEGMPTIGAILETLENIDKDLCDWRGLNHLFAHPTPHFKSETLADAKAVNAMLVKTGWKIGTALATNSDFNLKGTTGVEGNLLMLAITTNAKIISAHTGIAIHFLGFANVMSNRSTADDMGEPTEIVLHSEISSWNSFYKDLFEKAIRLRNIKLNGELTENLYVPKIVPLTDKQWGLIKELYTPLNAAGKISDRTFLEQIPGIDVDAEEERIAKESSKKEVKEDKDSKELLGEVEGKEGVKGTEITDKVVED